MKKEYQLSKEAIAFFGERLNDKSDWVSNLKDQYFYMNKGLRIASMENGKTFHMSPEWVVECNKDLIGTEL